MRCKLEYSKERVWERTFLKKKCKQVGVENEFLEYQIRLRANFVSVFLLLNLSFSLLHCILLLTTCEHISIIYADVGFYLASVVLVSLALWPNFSQDFVMKNQWIMYVTSIITVIDLVCVDILLNAYHYYHDDWITGSFYDTYIIFMIYMFLPIPLILPALMLGLSVSAIYISYFILYISSKYNYEMFNSAHYNHITASISYHLCLNLLGSFFRMMREIVVRSSFLDRHQYVMEDIWLRNAREQEKIFLHTILPPQIAQPIQDDIRNRIKSSQKHHSKDFSPRRDRIMAIQIHVDVTILYADVVNYTHLTTTLTVKTLVTLLHELYARFDMAAVRFRVQRIKFLGDCYYCVAGLVSPDPDHAKCCVDLGLCMIDNIRDVRAQQNVNIDIRVGVHSGSLFAGVIGAAKLQYDIWGSDVIIANHLEATGVAGYIHASERTFQMMMNHSYQVFPGTEAAQDDPYLVKYNIKTFLITSSEQTYIDHNISKDVLSIQTVPSSSAFQDRQSTIRHELRDEFKKMPVGPSSLKDSLKEMFNFGKRTKPVTPKPRSEIGVHFLHFRDPRLEYNYMRQPDYMLKYSILLAWSIGISMVFLQLIYDSGRVEISGFVDGLVMLNLSILLFITCCCVFRLAENIQRSLVKRICIYMFIIISYFLITFVMLLDCDKEEYEMLHIESKLYHYEPDLNMCFQPWVLTNMQCLIIGMSLIFTRIPFMMKIVVSILEAITYIIIMVFQFEYIVHQSLSTNPFFFAEYAHGMLIIMTLSSLYLKERQTEFNNKINYKWRIELIKKQRDALIADQSITILLHNILPAHVVDVYLTSIAKHELYYESYQMVAVMFASLKNFQLDLPNLRVLNEIITEFDRILSYYRDDYLVEKIKIVGCTYMAACGLDLRTSVVSEERGPHESVIQEVLRARHSFSGFNFGKGDKKEEVVFVLTTFALDLMRTLWMCNNDYKNVPVDRGFFNATMSIGISCGEVMAGVVGASQVHYDIWGNAVNMASRMESTGMAGHIQVTDETAAILRKYDLECSYRGMTFVKGRGILPTYFVEIDDHYEFKYIHNRVWRQDLSESLNSVHTNESFKSSKNNQ